MRHNNITICFVSICHCSNYITSSHLYYLSQICLYSIYFDTFRSIDKWVRKQSCDKYYESEEVTYLWIQLIKIESNTTSDNEKLILPLIHIIIVSDLVQLYTKVVHYPRHSLCMEWSKKYLSQLKIVVQPFLHKTARSNN